jgi:transcriptional regulator with XRE-family HTH domain
MNDSSHVDDRGAVSGDPDSQGLGKRIRGLRLARGYSIKELAGRAELSAGAISQLERDIGSPSIKSLRAIGRALDVPFVSFFEEESGTHSIVRRASQRRTLTFGKTGTVKDVLSVNSAGNLEILLVRVAAGGSSGGETYSHKGEEGGLVLAGTLDLWVAETRYVLRSGDSFGFKSSLPHRFANGGADELQVIWVNTRPQYENSY